MWEELQQEYEGRVEFVEVDHDDREGDRFARDHRVPYQPGLIVYNAAGDWVDSYLGVSERDMRAIVASALEEGS